MAGSPRCFAVSREGKRAVTGGTDEVAIVWDLESHAPIVRYEGHDGWVVGAALSPDGSLAATAGSFETESNDFTAHLWKTDSGELVRRFTGHRAALIDLAMSPDGSRLVSSADDRTVRVWDIATGEQLHVLTLPTRIHRLAFSPDGKLFAAAAAGRRRVDGKIDDPENCVVRLYRTATAELVQTLRGHSGSVARMAFAPNGRFLVTAAAWEHYRDTSYKTDDLTARVWDLTSGREIARIISSKPFRCVAMSPDSRTVLTSAGRPELVKLWRLPSRFVIAN